jgi:hypothetical protein
VLLFASPSFITSTIFLFFSTFTDNPNDPYPYFSRIQSALDEYSACLVIYNALDKEKNARSIATCYLKMGMCLQEMDQQIKALEHYQRCLVVREEELGADNLMVAVTLHYVGSAHSAMGAFDLALQVHTATSPWPRVPPRLLTAPPSNLL